LIDNEQKQRASKDILLPTRRNQHIGRSIHGYEANNTNDQHPDLSYDHDQEIHERLIYGPSNL